MTTNTQGIVLRNVKYGETSLITTIYTKKFGVQGYILRGARTAKKTAVKANYFQIGQVLDLTVYHKPNKELHYIKEVKLSADNAIQTQNIIKQSIIQYCCELILRCIKEEEENPELYTYLSNYLIEVKQKNKSDLALAPIQFTIQFAAKIGFEIHNNYSTNNKYFDAYNGDFCDDLTNNHYVQNQLVSELITNCISGQSNIGSSRQAREQTLNALILFLRLQIEQMGEIKSIDILHQILHN